MPTTNGTDQFVPNWDFPNLISAKRFANYLSTGRTQDVYVLMVKHINLNGQVSNKAPVTTPASWLRWLVVVEGTSQARTDCGTELDSIEAYA